MFDFAYTQDFITLRPRLEKRSFIGRFFAPPSPSDLDRLEPKDRDLLLAIADLRALGDGSPGELVIESDQIQLSHKLAAALNGAAAAKIGLPPLVDLTLRTDAEGLIGSPNFRLRCEWVKHGQRQSPRRIGAILETSAGVRRLPLWLMEAVEVAEAFQPGGDDIAHWTALARFRQALDPGVQTGEPGLAARVSMTDFLSGLQVRIADRFSITPNATSDDFEVVPFSSSGLNQAGLNPDVDQVTEEQGELLGEDLRVFQRRVRDRGAVPAYRLAPGSFLVVDRSALAALTSISEAQRSPAVEREAFIRNPRARITEAVEAALRQDGQLDGLSPDAEEEAVEAAAGAVFIETSEFSERVKGVRLFEKTVEILPGSGTTWLPEGFERLFAEALERMPDPELRGFRDTVQIGIDEKHDVVMLGELPIPARPETLAAVDAHIRQREISGGEKSSAEEDRVPTKPVILDAVENFEELLWAAKLRQRRAEVSLDLPGAVRTPLKTHQVEGFHWQIEAWRVGLPGVLNADEQGLGKTLQTLAFLVWLKTHMGAPGASERGPVLVVAPTSLLENWEREVSLHIAAPGLAA
jgi:hypothetical protein